MAVAGDHPPDDDGPSAALVIIASVVVAALAAGLVVGVAAVRSGEDEVVAPTVGDESAPTSAPAPAATLLLQRTTPAGIEVRAQVEGVLAPVGPVGSVPAMTMAPASTTPEDLDGDGTADICNPIGNLRSWAITDDALVEGGSPWTGGAVGGFYPMPLWGGPGTDIAAFAVQVDPDIVSVRLVGPDGAVDEMTPVGGAAVVAVPVEPGDVDDFFQPIDAGQFRIQARRADGTIFATDSAAMELGHPSWGGPGPCELGVGGPVIVEATEAEAESEVTLPAPGPGPADPATARAEIETNFELLYGGDARRADRLAVIDDPYGLEPILDEIVDGSLADRAAAAEVEILELVYTAPTDAVFTYQLTSPEVDWPVQVGRAHLVDGAWLITRQTWCQDLAKAGPTCPP